MTKSEEIAELRALAKRLGPDSYLAAWLSSIAYDVESLVRSDIYPKCSIAQSINTAADEAKAIVERATVDAQRITERAWQIEADARKEADAIRQRLYDAVHEAERAIHR